MVTKIVLNGGIFVWVLKLKLQLSVEFVGGEIITAH